MDNVIRCEVFRGEESFLHPPADWRRSGEKRNEKKTARWGGLCAENEDLGETGEGGQF